MKQFSYKHLQHTIKCVDKNKFLDVIKYCEIVNNFNIEINLLRRIYDFHKTIFFLVSNNFILIISIEAYRLTISDFNNFIQGIESTYYLE